MFGRYWFLAGAASLFLHLGALAALAFFAGERGNVPSVLKKPAERLTVTFRHTAPQSLVPSGTALLPVPEAAVSVPEKRAQRPEKRSEKRPEKRPEKLAKKPERRVPQRPAAETSAVQDVQEPVKPGVPGSPPFSAGVPQTAEPRAAPRVVDVALLNVRRRVKPDYPAIARKRKEQGTAVLLVALDGGRISQVRVERSSGSSMLDEAAARAVKQWDFEHRGSVQVRVPVTFTLTR